MPAMIFLMLLYFFDFHYFIFLLFIFFLDKVVMPSGVFVFEQDDFLCFYTLTHTVNGPIIQ